MYRLLHVVIKQLNKIITCGSETCVSFLDTFSVTKCGKQFDHPASVVVSSSDRNVSHLQRQLRQMIGLDDTDIHL